VEEEEGRVFYFIDQVSSNLEVMEEVCFLEVEEEVVED
jgi:hypothetical protein